MQALNCLEAWVRSSNVALVSFTTTTCTNEWRYYDQPPVSHQSDRRDVKGVWKVRMTWPLFKNGEKRDVCSTYWGCGLFPALFQRRAPRVQRQSYSMWFIEKLGRSSPDHHGIRFFLMSWHRWKSHNAASAKSRHGIVCICSRYRRYWLYLW